MNGYVRDVLLAVSVIGAPIVFGTLLYYGLTIKDRNHHLENEAREKDHDRGAAPPPDPDPGANATSA